MMDIEESDIAQEAHRLWLAEGSPLWGHPQDHWYRAIDNLKAARQRSGGPSAAEPEALRQAQH